MPLWHEIPVLTILWVKILDPENLLPDICCIFVAVLAHMEHWHLFGQNTLLRTVISLLELIFCFSLHHLSKLAS